MFTRCRPIRWYGPMLVSSEGGLGAVQFNLIDELYGVPVERCDEVCT